MISLLPDLTCDAEAGPVALTHDSHGDSSDTVLGKHGLPREPRKRVMTPQRGEEKCSRKHAYE